MLWYPSIYNHSYNVIVQKEYEDISLKLYIFSAEHSTEGCWVDRLKYYGNKNNMKNVFNCLNKYWNKNDYYQNDKQTRRVRFISNRIIYI